jgi:glycosyltransferase involved in cell wall biosynthesis
LTNTDNKKLFLLCASAYTATDFNLVGAYRQKAIKWGYFPEVKEHNISELFSKKKNDIPKLLWAGRLIDWKHPEYAVLVAHMLKQQGYKFKLDIIGIGEMYPYIESMVEKYQLGEYVQLLGSKSPNEVREYMEAANIFLFTSDFNEGWGAVY